MLVIMKNMKLLTVNWHLVEKCNYNCKFCYANFKDIQNRLHESDGKRLLDHLYSHDIYKVNFAGGEPFMHPNLAEFVRHAHNIGMKTSIITNGSLLKREWLQTNSSHVHQMGVSCDSPHEHVNLQIGRGYGQHVKNTKRVLSWLQGTRIKAKLNTVVMRQNLHDDWSFFFDGLDLPIRWKISKILKIKGENDAYYDRMKITDCEFRNFLGCLDQPPHIEIVPENNTDMTGSYIMMDPIGQLYQNTKGYYQKSSPILQVGTECALGQVGFDYEKFVMRGGNYEI